MEPQRRSSSHSSGGTRWSLDSIELGQPSLRFIMPGEENHHENFHEANNTGASERISSDGITQSSRDIEDITNRKAEQEAGITEYRTRSRATNRSILLGWWEEILSIAIAVLCTALSGAVLAYMDGRSLSDWGLRLQPSTLIALLATITRAALMYPLAECLGNLKWKYFERPRTLAHLQTFDAATRGPLGAAKYLWALPIHSPLATFVALLTLLLLLFQPFAQQTMSFASRTAPMLNETAHAFRATRWNMSSVDLQSPSREPFPPALQYALYQAISKEEADSSNNGHCSTTLCEFDNFDTLGVCSECEQHILNGHIGSLFGNCLWKDEIAANSTLFGMNGNATDETTTKMIIEEIKKRRGHEEFKLSVQCGPVRVEILRESKTIMHQPIYQTYFKFYLFSPSAARPYIRWPEFTEEDGYLDDMYYTIGSSGYALKHGELSVCDQAIAESYYDDLNTIMNSTCLSLITDLKSWFDEDAPSDQFGIIDVTETRCSLIPCVRRMVESRLQNNRLSPQSVHLNTKWHHIYTGDSDISNYLICSGDDAKCAYSWIDDSLKLLGSWINSTIATETFFKMYWTQTNSPRNNFTLFYQRMAAQVSALLQSQLNPDLSNFTGVAYGTEIYVQVRWMWFILPIVIMVSSLLIVMFIVGDSSRKDYLFKNNVLAAVAFELHGWEPHEYGVDETWTLHSMKNLEKKAERMVARMQLPHEGDGGLRLKRERDERNST